MKVPNQTVGKKIQLNNTYFESGNKGIKNKERGNSQTTAIKHIPLVTLIYLVSLITRSEVMPTLIILFHSRDIDIFMNAEF